MDLWWFKATSRANQDGNKLRKGKEFDAMGIEWFKMQADLIRTFFPQLVVPYQADVRKFIASCIPAHPVKHGDCPYILKDMPICCLSPSSPTTTASMMVVPQYHHSSIIRKCRNQSQIERGHLKDVAASVILCLLSQHSEFATADDARQGCRVATACCARGGSVDGNSFHTGQYLAECERNHVEHNIDFAVPNSFSLP
jgi:hypothetical protein